MTGLEIADFLKWPAIVAGVIGLIALARWWIRQEARDRAELGVLKDTEKDRHDADSEYQKDLGDSLDAWDRNRRLPDSPDRGSASS